MATNPDSSFTSIAVAVSWSANGVKCLPPAFVEALQQANFRINLPNDLANPQSATFAASTLSDNVFRIDSTGAGYVPGIIKIAVAEQTLTLAADDAPGEMYELVFSAPGVNDLENALNNIYFTIEPPQSPVNIGPPRKVGSEIRYTVTRMVSIDTAPFDVIVVSGRGALFVIPSPEPA